MRVCQFNCVTAVIGHAPTGTCSSPNRIWNTCEKFAQIVLASEDDALTSDCSGVENCPAAEWCSIELREVGPCNES